jgi:hypothetical protein
MNLFHEGENLAPFGFVEIDEEAEQKPVPDCPCGADRLYADDACSVCGWEPDREALWREKEQPEEDQVFDAIEEMMDEYNN